MSRLRTVFLEQEVQHVQNYPYRQIRDALTRFKEAWADLKRRGNLLKTFSRNTPPKASNSQ